MADYTKRVAETISITVDFRDRLAPDELLSGTPTVAEVGTSDLTINGESLTTSPADPIGRSYVPTSQGVAFLVAGGTAGTTYTIRVTQGTDATLAQTLIRDITLRVN